MTPTIKVKRVYEDAEKDDGHRILADRLWPRGVSKEKAAIVSWEKELAPSPGLRTWFGHKPELWPEFKKRYKAELQENTFINLFVKKHKNDKVITLLYAGKDEGHTHVLMLREYLEQAFTGTGMHL
jgi:uncharacterized protein YeaO (DUF488 family)